MVRKTTKSPKTKAMVSGHDANPIADAMSDSPSETDAPVQSQAESADATVSGMEFALVKRELIDRVVIASGIKKKAAKPVVEAVLKEMGDALSRGETLNLQPFGKVSIKKHKDLEHAEIIEVRLRRSKLAIKAAEAAANPDTPVAPLDPLAEAAE